MSADIKTDAKQEIKKLVVTVSDKFSQNNLLKTSNTM